MPQDYILNRVAHEKDGTIEEWNKLYDQLSDNQKKSLLQLIKDGRLQKIPTTKSLKMNRILSHYKCELLENNSHQING